MNAPNCSVDFYDETTLQNPAEAFRDMHKCGPVVWLEKNNILAICGFELLKGALRNHQVFSSGQGVSIDEDVNKLLVGSTLNSDPPTHDVTRAITFSPLTPKAFGDIRERIQKEANYIVEKMVGQREFDGAAELAPYLPLTIVRDLVGLGDHGRANMLDWGAATFELMGDPGSRREIAVQNLKAMRRFLESPETLDHLDELGWAKRAMKIGIEKGFGHRRASELMRDYIAPSLDTTISAIGFAIMLFARHPEQWDKLREDRSRIKNSIEEVVRLNTPIRAFTRLAREDIVVGGVPVCKGDRVMMVFGAANRDPDRFENPDDFDIERDVRGHVGFGHGNHACLGMHLARLEITCLFEALVDHVKRFELIGPVTYGINSSIHSLFSVPVRTVT